jgi:integrase
MRKTFGMNVYLRTEKNVVAAQKALGHASLASTTHYLSIGQDEVDAAILA